MTRWTEVEVLGANARPLMMRVAEHAAKHWPDFTGEANDSVGFEAQGDAFEDLVALSASFPQAVMVVTSVADDYYDAYRLAVLGGIVVGGAELDDLSDYADRIDEGDDDVRDDVDAEIRARLVVESATALARAQALAAG